MRLSTKIASNSWGAHAVPLLLCTDVGNISTTSLTEGVLMAVHTDLLDEAHLTLSPENDSVLIHNINGIVIINNDNIARSISFGDRVFRYACFGRDGDILVSYLRYVSVLKPETAVVANDLPVLVDRDNIHSDPTVKMILQGKTVVYNKYTDEVIIEHKGQILRYDYEGNIKNIYKLWKQNTNEESFIIMFLVNRDSLVVYTSFDNKLQVLTLSTGEILHLNNHNPLEFDGNYALPDNNHFVTHHIVKEDPPTSTARVWSIGKKDPVSQFSFNGLFFVTDGKHAVAHVNNQYKYCKMTPCYQPLHVAEVSVWNGKNFVKMGISLFEDGSYMSSLDKEGTRHALLTMDSIVSISEDNLTVKVSNNNDDVIFKAETLSAASEWADTLSAVRYNMTFVPQYQNTDLHEMKIRYRQDLLQMIIREHGALGSGVPKRTMQIILGYSK
jgi:hypothetical protein